MKRLPQTQRLISEILWKSRIFRYKVEFLPDNPDPISLRDRIVYVVGTQQYVKWAYLKCPSGCGDVILLNLTKSTSPSWRISSDNLGRPTISPSIHKMDGCKSHFWLRNGSIDWVKR